MRNAAKTLGSPDDDSTQNYGTARNAKTAATTFACRRASSPLAQDSPLALRELVLHHHGDLALWRYEIGTKDADTKLSAIPFPADADLAMPVP